jgi:hypothetical protein
MVAPSFEVKQKVLQLVVQRIVVEDHRIVIEHVVPSGPIRLQPERHAAANPSCPASRGTSGYAASASAWASAGAHDTPEWYITKMAPEPMKAGMV